MEKIIRLIIEVSGVVGVIILVGMMAVTVADVIGRYFFRRPIIGSMEISIHFMVCVVFLGMGWCALNDGHIRVDIITDKLSKRGEALLDGFDNLATLIVGLIIAWRSYIEVLTVKEMDVNSPILGIPRYPFVFVTAFGFLLLFFAALILFIRDLKSFKDANKTD